MKKLALTIYFCLASLLMAQDRKISEFPQRYRFTLNDRLVLIATNASGVYSNFTISGQNLIESLGGVITNNTAAISNSVTANITNLLSVTIVTNYLDSDGDSISFSAGGNFANSAAAKSLFVALGGTILFQATNIVQTLVITNGWRIQGDIIRRGSASYIASVGLFSLAGSAIAGNGTNWSSAATSFGVESLLTNNTLAIQTRGITAGDVTNHFLKVINEPVLAPQ